MEPFTPRKFGGQGPEAKIQRDIILMLETKGWWTKTTHGNAHTDGWPDIWASHKTIGNRWIEVKLPNMKGSHFTSAQLRDFPQFNNVGGGVWVITAATEEEYLKLFKEPNWWMYLSILR